MEFQYSKLRGRIREVCGTDKKFAELMGVSKATISAKLNNRTEFSQPEILLASQILGLECSEIPTYFFTPTVQVSKLITVKEETV